MGNGEVFIGAIIEVEVFTRWSNNYFVNVLVNVDKKDIYVPVIMKVV